MNGSAPAGIRASALRPRLGTLRARVTIFASLAITTAVILGFLVMYLLQIHALQRSVDGQLRTYITQIEQTGQDGHWPRPLPPSTLDTNAEAQVLNARGDVLASTQGLAGLPDVYLPAVDATQPVRQKAADNVVPTEVQVAAARTSVGGQHVAIVVVTPTVLLHQLNSQFAVRLLLAVPVVLILAAGAVWLIVGRSLRPVERIRRAVTEITSADLSHRVPEPGTADEIGHLAHTMNDMLDRLDAASRRQRRFVADASHELRTPITAFRTTLEVGLAYPDKAPWPVIAERATQQATRLEELIEQLLLLAGADERQSATRQDAIDLTTLLRDTVSRLPEPRVPVELHAEANLAVTGDTGQLERLLRNIIDNALRYAKDRVEVTAAAHGALAQVHVDDDGRGIPPADRNRVFDRFVRLDASRERVNGGGTAGLGLAIAREIAHAHLGEITLVERPGGGTRAVVTLPRRRPEDKRSRTASDESIP
jgi:signal transduction histidine kinase